MPTRWIRRAAVLATALGAAGCGGRYSLSYYDVSPPPRRTHVYIDDHHVCTSRCHDHYWNGTRVVVLAGHRHGPGCGHVLRSGRWIVVSDHGDHVHVTTPHVCTLDCHNHYWNGVKLVVLKRHHHGPGCGHVFRSGRWIVSVSARTSGVHVGAGHVCTRSCHQHYWNGKRLVVLKGHHHGPGCGHVFKRGRWVVLAKTTAKKVRPHKAKVVKKKAPAKSKRTRDDEPPRDKKIRKKRP